MKIKKVLLEETAKRYCEATKKEKRKIIDELAITESIQSICLKTI